MASIPALAVSPASRNATWSLWMPPTKVVKWAVAGTPAGVTVLLQLPSIRTLYVACDLRATAGSSGEGVRELSAPVSSSSATSTVTASVAESVPSDTFTVTERLALAS